LKTLQLPSYPFKTRKKAEGFDIWDDLRRKYVKLTPEEWVRQHMVQYLIQYQGFPKGLISVEHSIRYMQQDRRSDIVCYNTMGEPLMLIECKAPEVNINQKVFEQSALYNSILKAPYLVVSNGICHYCCQINHETRKYVFLENIPAYESIKDFDSN
jgi:type I site-specific restriction endonuclease